VSFDVIVVGFGFAGGVAAMAAHDVGARVLVLEKQPDPGGISVCSAGGVRIARDAGAAFEYLTATNAGTTPAPVMRALAEGMTRVAEDLQALADACGARVGLRDSPGNYPLPGADTFGFAYIDEVPGFDAGEEFPQVRGSPAGARLFKLVLEGVRRRGIEVRTGARVSRLMDELRGVVTDGGKIEAARGVVLACGGFEGDAEMQRQHWQIKPVLSAAVRGNTGDGVRMAQAAGAGLWHMWHFHGSYGFRHPDAAYPFGVRLKRLPDWMPGRPPRNDVHMSWILLDRDGRRFMNEYDPYLQDTGHRPLELFDPVTQSYPRIPAALIVDAAGRRQYPLSAPTWHDRDVATLFGNERAADFDERILVRGDTLAELAAALGLPPAAVEESVRAWNTGHDPFGRPRASMLPIAEPPFFGAHVWPIVSNTQGGPAHDERQRVLDAFGAPIPRLFVAGELGSVFGHLYMSGGNLAECFIGGRIAGRGAAGVE
jgi:succinate dehydrogenase/fumarate reductase flavoprotein subunit